ncbi:MAG: hypothetical protein DMC60_10125 [Verrucomicrobia bacterium]|nr:MAG: hypothetical protein DMC60_10125 [Verrucomicrobiota bacterium]
MAGRGRRSPLLTARGNRPRDFHARDCPVENNALADSRDSATIVNTPRIVPKGMKRHSMQATTSAKE